MIFGRVKCSDAVSLTTRSVMRLPRRVPWSSQKELLELHTMLWDDFEDEQARRRALSRVSMLDFALVDYADMHPITAS